MLTTARLVRDVRHDNCGLEDKTAMVWPKKSQLRSPEGGFEVTGRNVSETKRPNSSEEANGGQR
jgi:hypothetical protein